MKRGSNAFSPVIAVDRKAAKPLHLQIYDACRSMMLSGSLRPGQQLPSTRALASELNVSRIPVLTAYAQLLAEGYFETCVGSGTFVCRSLPDQFTRSERGPVRTTDVRPGPRPVARRTLLHPRYQRPPWFGLGAFSVGQSAYDQFPFRIWSSLVMRHCRAPQASSLHYGDPLGFQPLREAICTYLRTARAVSCDPRQIMIVAGSQQALEISARVLLDPISSVWVEEPGYWMTQRVLHLAGCRLIPVPVDNEGLNVAAGIRKCRKARAAYVAPSHQYPLGSTMSATRRLQLLEWARNSGSWIIEDDYDSEYRYGSMPVASLQGLDAESRVIYIGTFSKVLFPSLRVGYVVIPPDLVDHFVAVRQSIDLSAPLLYQAVLTDFMREGHFARHIRRMRVLYEQRRTALVESVREEFGATLQVLGAQAGMHLLLELPKGFHDLRIAKEAARRGLWLAPLSGAYLEKPSRQGLVLGFGGTPVAEMPAAVRQLKSVLSGQAELAQHEAHTFQAPA